MKFIEANKDRPFFLYLPHAMPHKPLAPGEAFYGRAARDSTAMRSRSWIGASARSLAKLKELKLEERHLVIFTSDNGPWYGGSTGGLRGMKGTTWEGGIRVPLIARLPGKIPAGHTSREPAIMMDLFSTILRLADAAAPGDRTIDGRDIWPLLTSSASSPHEALYFFRGETVAAVRSGPWKLHVAAPGGSAVATKQPGPRWIDPRAPDGVRILAPFEQYQPTDFPGVSTGERFDKLALFDLAADTAEQRNRAADQPQIVERLKRLAASISFK